MLSRIALAVVVGVITALVVALIGYILVEVGLVSIGGFVKGISALVGLLAGVWFFFTGQTPNNAV